MHRVEIFQANSPAALKDQLNLFITKIEAMDSTKLLTVQYGGVGNGIFSALVLYVVGVRK